MKIESASDVFIVLGAIVGLILLCGWWNAPPPADYNNGWSPRDYVPQNPGDCYVPPQGDPLYDEHYAKNVNNPNCKALIDQSTSKNIDAQTERTELETTKDRLGLWAVIGVVVLVFFMLLIAALKH